MATMRNIVFGYGISVRVGGGATLWKTKSGGFKVNVALHDVSATDATGPTGTGQEDAYGLDRCELTLSLFADADQQLHATPFSVLPRQDISVIEIYYWGVNKDPYVIRNLRCDTPIDAKWDTPNPNMLDIHGFSNDYDIPLG